MAEELQGACASIKAADESLQWEWDPRFGAALAAFDRAVEPKVLAALDDVFDKVWSAAELAGDSGNVGELARRLGGLRSGQMLLTAFADPILYCAWWPWGSGERISIRIGSVPPDDRLRGWFGL